MPVALRVPECILAFCLAFCFAAAGDLVRGRLSHSLAGWNTSFLAGLAVAATSLFPLSLLLPRHALWAVLLCLVGCGCWRLYRVGRPAWPRRPVWPALDWLEWLLLALIAFQVCQFCVHNLRLSFLWDGYQIWATKALVLYHHGALTSDLFIPGRTDRITGYPPMVSMYEALLSLARGEFEWNALKPIFPFFYVSMLLSTYRASRAVMSRRWALGATAILALLPAVSSRDAIGGYADMPQAAFVIATLAALLVTAREGAPRNDPTPWLLAGVPMVKSEGSILFCIFCGAIVLFWLVRYRAQFLMHCRRYAPAIAIVATSGALRMLYLIWANPEDRTYGPLDRAHLVHAQALLLAVPASCLRHLLNRTEWGLFWPAFGAAAVLLLLAGGIRQRMIALACGVGICLYTSIFYVTNWKYQVHIDQAYDRLLCQLAPVAALCIAAAFARCFGEQDG